MRVSIVGTGYVGLVSGVGLASIGHTVTCVDLDPAKVDSINRGVPPIHEEGLEELLGRVAGSSLVATTDLHAAVLGSDLTLIAVGTPFDGSTIDLTYVEAASRQIGAALADKDGYHVVVVKSTVVPGTTETTVLPLVEQASGRTAGEGFGIGMNPEFLREGSALADFVEPDRIVLGGIDERSLDVMAELYAPFTATEVVRTTPRTAEMIKYAANSLLATLISFSNEMANLSATVGVDAMEAMQGVHLDRRFTTTLEDGTRVRPGMLTYLEGGCGFGGSCFPKDVKALVAYGERSGSPMRLLQSVLDVNETQPALMLDLLGRHLPDVTGRRVTVLGMAFKPGTDDIRESPSLPVTHSLLEAGADVTVYDVTARHESVKVFGDTVRHAQTLADAVDGAEAVLVMTRWAEFEELPALLAGRADQPVVVDGRRLLPKDTLPRYEAIGL